MVANFRVDDVVRHGADIGKVTKVWSVNGVPYVAVRFTKHGKAVLASEVTLVPDADEHADS